MNVPWLVQVTSVCQPSGRCAAMRSEDGVVLCRAHSDGRSCSARDYILHTVDMVSAMLSTPEPAAPGQHPSGSSMCLLSSVCKLWLRIFMHLHDEHLAAFQACEASTSLYARLRALVGQYQLLPEDMLPDYADVALDTASLRPAQVSDGVRT